MAYSINISGANAPLSSRALFLTFSRTSHHHHTTAISPQKSSLATHHEPYFLSLLMSRTSDRTNFDNLFDRTASFKFLNHFPPYSYARKFKLKAMGKIILVVDERFDNGPSNGIVLHVVNNNSCKNSSFFAGTILQYICYDNIIINRKMALVASAVRRCSTRSSSSVRAIFAGVLNTRAIRALNQEATFDLPVRHHHNPLAT